MNNMLLIISSEYLSRVKKKGFVIATLLMPLLLVGLMVAPALLPMLVNDEVETITVIDKSGSLMPEMIKNGSLPYQFPSEADESIIGDENHPNVLIIGADAVANPSDVYLYTQGSLGFETQMLIKDDIKQAIEALRLKAYNIDNLAEILAEVEADVDITTMKVDANGDAAASDVLTSMIVGLVVAMLLYFFIIVYGQMVMQSVIEEKTSRVLEMIVTSVKPFQLMMGKLIGVLLVAVTQVAAWAVIIAVVIGVVIPNVGGEELVSALSFIASTGYIFSIFGYLLLFLIGGFMLYASIYAAIGASVDNIQDASQLQMFATLPVIIGFICAVTSAQSPDSSFSFWLSIIPFTSPMVMMTRIPSGAPLVEVVGSLLILYATILLIVWFTAKIYRIGIFMYGKKPTIKEIVRWAKQK